MEVFTTDLKQGIARTREFERKGLAAYSVNVGTKCGHCCTYCSSGSLLRMHPSFVDAGRSPFANDYAIVDPATPERVKRDARRKLKRGLVQVCTTVDPYSPEAQEYGLGRRCLEAILAEPGWTVRILTKNAAVSHDFDAIGEHRDRVLVGLSITATREKTVVMSVVEPHASPLTDRMAALQEAHVRGLRTYAMFCPLLPGIADAPEQIDELVRFAVDCGAEEIFAEPINPRGPGLKVTATALQENGYCHEAEAVSRIRRRAEWSGYVVNLVSNLQESVRAFSDIDRLRVLLYPAGLAKEAEADVRRDDAGVVWLEKTKAPDRPRGGALVATVQDLAGNSRS